MFNITQWKLKKKNSSRKEQEWDGIHPKILEVKLFSNANKSQELKRETQKINEEAVNKYFSNLAFDETADY